jgi:hypothetical protein
MTISLLAKPNRSAFLGEPITQDQTLILFQFDASIVETFTKNAEVTDHPVESGADVTDHIRRLPREIEIRGWVSDNPIVLFPSAEFGLPPRSRAQDAYAELCRIMDEGQLVKVVTSLTELENMALTSINVSRDKDTGQILDATIGLREVVVATTEVTEPPEPRQRNRQKKRQIGKQTTKQPDDSLAFQLFSAIGG